MDCNQNIARLSLSFSDFNRLHQKDETLPPLRNSIFPQAVLHDRLCADADGNATSGDHDSQHGA